MDSTRNPEERGLLVGVLVGMAGLALMIAPAALSMSGMDGAYALGAFGLMLLILGAITAAVRLPRTRAVDRMLEGVDLLARWQYGGELHGRQVANDLQSQLQRNRRLLLIILAWWAVWVAVFTVIGHAEGQGDAMPLFVGIMVGVLAIVAAAALGIPHLMARRAMARPEALIGRHGILLHGTFYSWDAPLNQLQEVALSEDSPRPQLVITLRSRSGPYLAYGAPLHLTVPVPAGELTRARRIAGELSLIATGPQLSRSHAEL